MKIYQMKSSLIFISIMLCLLVSSASTIPKVKIMTNEQNGIIKQIWMLKNGDPKSPWNIKIVPAFLDFISIPNKVIARGRSDSSITVYCYTISNNEILTNKAKFKIIALSLNNLVLQIGEDYYSYYSLKKSAKEVNKTSIFNILTNNKRWIIGGDTIQFSRSNDNIEFVVGTAFYVLNAYKENRKFYGTYYIDIFEGHVFLCFLIDGEYQEKIYEIVKIDNKVISYKEVGSDNIIEALSTD
jgi:hypothetical protein